MYWKVTCANKTFSTNISLLDHGIVPPEQVQAPSLADILNADDQIKHHILLWPEPCVSHVSQSNPQTHTHTQWHVARRRIMANLMTTTITLTKKNT